MRAMLRVMLFAAALFPPGQTASAETPEPAAAEMAAPDDLTGWRLCPACDRLNPPDADYCMYCGTDLAPKVPATWSRTPFTLSGEVPFSGESGLFIAGIGVAHDGGGWSDEFIVTPLFIFIPLGGFNDLHIYLRQGELRPYASVMVGGYDLPEFEGYQADDFFLTAGAAGGARFNYDGRGSYIYGSGGLGLRRRGGESYEARDGPVFWYKTRFTHFFHEYIGLTGSVQGWNAELLASGGVALAL